MLAAVVADTAIFPRCTTYANKLLWWMLGILVVDDQAVNNDFQRDKKM